MSNSPLHYSTDWDLTAPRCPTDGVKPGERNFLLWWTAERDLFTRWLSNETPLSLSWSATHFEARLQYVRWSLFSITLLTFMAWAQHSESAGWSISISGIGDRLSLPSLTAEERSSVSYRSLFFTIQRVRWERRAWHTVPWDCINRCFQGKIVDHSHRDQMEVCIHVCTHMCVCFCVHRNAQIHLCILVYCVFIVFYVCISTRQHSWDRLNCFLFFHTPPVSSWPRRPSLAVGGIISLQSPRGRHVSSSSLTGVFSIGREHWDLFNTEASTLLCLFFMFLFPPSHFPTLLSLFQRNAVEGFPHLQHIRVFMLQQHSPQSS